MHPTPTPLDTGHAAQPTAAAAPPVAAVLWDCDGVLQHGILGALAELTTLIGKKPLPSLLAEEGPALRGEETMRHCLARVIDRLGLPVTPEQVLPAWDRYELDSAALAVLAAVRDAGTPCYLATNQNDYRRDRMRTVSGYDDLVDGSYYSCEMGVAKPDPAFFRHIVTDLALPSGSLLFLDDNAENVTSAQAEGLRAELVAPGPVAPQLTRVLARHGIELRGQATAGAGKESAVL